MWSAIVARGLSFLNGVLGLLNKFMAESHDDKMRADGARQGELERRDAEDEIKADAAEHRAQDNSATDDDVLGRL